MTQTSLPAENLLRWITSTKTVRFSKNLVCKLVIAPAHHYRPPLPPLPTHSVADPNTFQIFILLFHSLSFSCCFVTHLFCHLSVLSLSLSLSPMPFHPIPIHLILFHLPHSHFTTPKSPSISPTPTLTTPTPPSAVQLRNGGSPSVFPSRRPRSAPANGPCKPSFSGACVPSPSISADSSR